MDTFLLCCQVILLSIKILRAQIYYFFLSVLKVDTFHLDGIQNIVAQENSQNGYYRFSFLVIM